MTGTAIDENETPLLQTLPTDEIRQMMWRFAERDDLQGIVQSTRSVARGLVARLVADGERGTNDWTDAKNQLLAAFDEAGISAVMLHPEGGGFLSGSKSQALALSSFELAWVDGGAAACNLAGGLVLQAIVESGTSDQKQEYLSRCAPSRSGEERSVARGAICLSEPLPDIGSDTGTLSGKVKVARSNDGEVPILQVSKRGRFIANMDFADFVVVAVESDDRRIEGTCLVILEEDDDGLFDRGQVLPKLAQQLSSVRDPVFDLEVPASRIVGGYTVKDGVIVANLNHSVVLKPVFARARIATAVMTAAKLLSAVEPIIRYQRCRDERGQGLGRDALHRLVDVWATGEAAASFGFAAARHLDGCEARLPDEEHLKNQSVANVLSLAAKLWSAGHGAAVMRDAVSLMGDYGLTEDCPGFLPQKWMDAQFEAAQEEPEFSLRRELSVAMADEIFLAQFRQWIFEMKRIASLRPGTGACAVGSAMDLWLWTLEHLQQSRDADDKPIADDKRQEATFSLGGALCWLLATRFQILDVVELASKGAENPNLAGALPGYVQFFTDLCHVQSARAAGEVGRICAELVFGYHRHPSWDPTCDACVQADEVDALEALIPGISYGTRIASDVMEADGSHAEKRGPCVRFSGLRGFLTRRSKLDGCLTGSRLAKGRAARALTGIAIPEALDYPGP